jgi:predicted nucleic acid-binding Zn ribbon protein
MRGQSRLDSFGSILAGVAHRLGLESKLFEARLRRQWPDIVGKPIAAHTRPDQIRFKKLYVLVHNSVWLQQLTFLKPVLLEKVNAMAGEPLVTEIVLRIGEFTADHSSTAEATAEATADVGPPAIQPSPQLLREVTLHAQSIQDQALREHLVTLMAQALSQPETPPRSARRSP